MNKNGLGTILILIGVVLFLKIGWFYGTLFTVGGLWIIIENYLQEKYGGENHGK